MEVPAVTRTGTTGKTYGNKWEHMGNSQKGIGRKKLYFSIRRYE